MSDQELIDRIRAAQELVQQRREALLRNEAAKDQLKESIGLFRTKLESKGNVPRQLDELINAKRAELEGKLSALEAKVSE